MHRRTVSLTAPPLQTARGRLLIAIAILVFISIAILFTPRSTIRAHITGAYPYIKPSTPQIQPPAPNPSATTPPPSNLIVKVQIPGEDLNWLLKLLPTWRNQVITLDASFARLHAGAQRVDAGRVAAAYLDWLITNYDALSPTMVFVGPGLEKQADDAARWRIPDKELVQSIRDLSVEHVQKEGYAPLVCPSVKECEDAIKPFRSPSDEFRTLEVQMAKAWQGLFNNTDVPDMLAGAGGKEFVVSKEQVRKRKVEEYVRYWEWLATTKMDDETAGRVVERLWHVVFGRESAWCPEEQVCRCEVFGRC